MGDGLGVRANKLDSGINYAFDGSIAATAKTGSISTAIKISGLPKNYSSELAAS